jgi:hypothetical protein
MASYVGFFGCCGYLVILILLGFRSVKQIWFLWVRFRLV